MPYKITQCYLPTSDNATLIIFISTATGIAATAATTIATTTTTTTTQQQ